MEDKENKPRSCLFGGPGPIYKLPTLIGYTGHDPSRFRGPAYSLRSRVGLQGVSIGPGPWYNVRKLTKHGVDESPAYTIAGREAFKIQDNGPGPGAYYPEYCPPMNHSRRAPAYSIKSRGYTTLDNDKPAPNTYTIPSCIGPKVPDKYAQAAFSMGGYQEIREKLLGPGPAAYPNQNLNLIKKRSPAYSLRWRHRLEQDHVGPGPRYLPEYNTGRRPPMYSFGVKHNECATNPISELDED